MINGFRPISVAALALFLAVAACSTGDTGTTQLSTSTSLPASTTTPTDTTSSTANPTSTTSSPAPTTTTPPTTTSTTLAGEPIDVGPTQGDVLGVVGVTFDDVLNVRAAPGTDQTVIATLAPTADDVVATGKAWKLPASIWFEVTANGTTGWAGSSFLAYLGPVDDVTASVISNLGETPTASSMLDLGMLVADEFAITDPASKVTVTVAPTAGDLGEVTIDVIGLADDSVAGVRLHVFGTPDGSGFTLKSIEQTLLCGRGVTGEGECL